MIILAYAVIIYFIIMVVELITIKRFNIIWIYNYIISIATAFALDYITKHGIN